MKEIWINVTPEVTEGLSVECGQFCVVCVICSLV